MPRYLITHIVVAVVIGAIAAVVAGYWAPLPFGLIPTDALISGGLFYVGREAATSGLVMPDGSWKRDWTYPLAVTGALAVLGRLAFHGGML